MVRLVADEVLYLKVDQETIPDYEELGLGPFVYEKKGKKVAMSYYQAQEAAVDLSSDLCEWAEKAYRAALRAKQKKPASRSTRRPRPTKKISQKTNDLIVC